MDKTIFKRGGTADRQQNTNQKSTQTTINYDIADMGEFFIPTKLELIHLASVDPLVCVYCFRETIESCNDVESIKQFMGALLLPSFSITDKDIVKILQNYTFKKYWFRGIVLDWELLSLTLHCLLAAWPVPAKNEAVDAVRKTLGAANIWESHWSWSRSSLMFDQVILLRQMASEHDISDAGKAGEVMLEALKARYLFFKC